MVATASVSSMMKTKYVSEKQFLYGKFPDDFEWAVATSSYQVEGGAAADGKGPSIWDVFTHEEGKIADGSNGDTACDSYHKYKTDVAMLRRLGVTSYRFSISWPRLMPFGTKRSINQAGIDYYNNLINELIKYDIKPIVTLYHWDLPNAIQKSIGGWQNDKIVGLFGDYADLCFRSFGDRVKHWITLNEPRVSAFNGYENGAMAPGKQLAGTGAYQASYVMLKAHARAYHIYNDTYRATQNGKIAITLNCDWGQPKNEYNLDDLAAADRYMQWYVGIYAHPIYHGDWPDVIKKTVARKSAAEGLTKSRLPAFTREEIKYIKGTNDFFGLNTYTSRLVTKSVSHTAGFMEDRDVEEHVSPKWKGSASSWLYSVPWGVYKLLTWIKRTYPSYGEIFITENGFSTPNTTLLESNICDPSRIDFYEAYINNVLKAIHYKNVNVVGYTAWSLMDNFEWTSGYTARFGIHYVNFTDTNRARTPKSSAIYFRNLVSANGFPSRKAVDAWRREAINYCKGK